MLEGVDFRATSRLSDPNNRFSPRDWYMAFNGKKAPGNGFAQLPYALATDTEPFRVSARMGVFDEDALAASAGAEGCIGLRDTESADEHRLCVTYQTAPANLEVAFGAATADCASATRAELRLEDDGVNVTARYRCAANVPFSVLDTAASLWADDEKWNAFVSAEGVAKGGQVAFDDFRLASATVDPGDPDEILFLTFEAWRLGVEAFYEIEDEDPVTAGALAGEASGKLAFAATGASDSASRKLLRKAASTAQKLVVSSTKYQKGFMKLAGIEADALEALDAGP